MERNYPNKEKWYDTTIYGGHFCAAKIIQGNGDENFDVDRFINSEMGEKILGRIMNELVVYGGDHWDHPDMTQYWAERGVEKIIHNATDRANAWITYVPDTIERNAGKLYPVVFCFHGGGGTLFESENHGFVHLCREKQYMVICPENQNSQTTLCGDRIGYYLEQMERMGLPIDRSRVYLTGMSMGGIAAIYNGLTHNSEVAAIAPHSCGGIFEGGEHFLPLTDEMYANAEPMPMYLILGQNDFKQLPLAPGVIDGLNKWNAMCGCHPIVPAPEANLVGISGDNVEERMIDGTMHTTVSFDSEQYGNIVNITGVEGHPHWVCYSFAELAWPFLSRFRRVNGKLERIEEA